MTSAAGALIWSPFGDEQTAEQAARQMLDAKLVACANIMPVMRSLFMWQGTLDSAQECGVLFKLDARLLDAAIARLAEIHPYDTPAIVGWRCDAAAPATLGWLVGGKAG